MKLHKLRFKQRLPLSLEEAWSFFSDPKNLGVLTPEEMKMQFLELDQRPIYPGKLITFRVSPFPGYTATWSSLISQVKEQEYFIDEQLTGPYAVWYHQHFFNPLRGGTEVEDIVHYALPFGFLGRLLDKPLVKPRIRALFEYRRKKLIQLFGEY